MNHCVLQSMSSTYKCNYKTTSDQVNQSQIIKQIAMIIKKAFATAAVIKNPYKTKQIITPNKTNGLLYKSEPVNQT